MPLSPRDRNSGLSKADPGAHAAQVAMVLRHFKQFIHDAPGHQAKVPSIQREANSRESRDQPVERVVAKTQPPDFLAMHPLRVHDVEAFAVFLQEERNRFRRVLQISIHRNDCVARSLRKTCAQRGLMAEVSRQYNTDQPIILLRFAAQNIRGSSGCRRRRLRSRGVRQVRRRGPLADAAVIPAALFLHSRSE